MYNPIRLYFLDLRAKRIYKPLIKDKKEALFDLIDTFIHESQN